MERAIVQGVYVHALGDRYEVLGKVIHPETKEEIVVYRKAGEEAWEWSTCQKFLSRIELQNKQEVFRFTHFSLLSEGYIPPARIEDVVPRLFVN